MTNIFLSLRIGVSARVNLIRSATIFFLGFPDLIQYKLWDGVGEFRWDGQVVRLWLVPIFVGHEFHNNMSAIRSGVAVVMKKRWYSDIVRNILAYICTVHIDKHYEGRFCG